MMWWRSWFCRQMGLVRWNSRGGGVGQLCWDESRGAISEWSSHADETERQRHCCDRWHQVSEQGQCCGNLRDETFLSPDKVPGPSGIAASLWDWLELERGQMLECFRIECWSAIREVDRKLIGVVCHVWEEVVAVAPDYCCSDHNYPGPGSSDSCVCFRQLSGATRLPAIIISHQPQMVFYANLPRK